MGDATGGCKDLPGTPLAAPLLAARQRITIIAAAALFLLGATGGIIPSPIPAWTDWGYLRFLGSFLALMGLGVVYAAMGIQDLRNRTGAVVPRTAIMDSLTKIGP